MCVFKSKTKCFLCNLLEDLREERCPRSQLTGGSTETEDDGTHREHLEDIRHEVS